MNSFMETTHLWDLVCSLLTKNGVFQFVSNNFSINVFFTYVHLEVFSRYKRLMEMTKFKLMSAISQKGFYARLR